MTLGLDICKMKEVIEAANANWPGAMSFEEYKALSVRFADEGKTSGLDQSASMVEYSRLNAHRLKRIDKTVALNTSTVEELSAIKETQTWIVFSETWCGDAAQNMPILAKMAAVNPLIDFKVLLRDEHPDLMKHFLTNGGKSIPKLAAFNEKNELLFTWGPRPEAAQEMVMDYKHSPEPKKPYTEFVVEVQKWYAKDKGQSIQQEFISLINEGVKA